jgi:HK97 family phage major capsid protein
MQLTQARQLREQRAKLVNDAQALLSANQTLSAEQRTQFDKMMADADLLKADIDRYERIETVEAEGRSAPPAARPDGVLSGMKPEERANRHRAAYRNYLKFGIQDLSSDDRAIMQEYRDMGTGGGNALQGTGGGYFVPVGFVHEIEEAMKFYGSMLQSSEIMKTATGQPLPWPTDNDTTNTGAILGEGVQVTEQDVTISNITFGAYKFTTKMVKVSMEMLQDSAFDIESYLKNKFSVRLGRIQNTKFTVGSGSSEPYGIVTQATLGTTATGAATNDGGAETGGTTIGSDDLTNLEHSVDVAYRRGAAYMMHDTTIQALKKVKDKYGRPLWMPGVAVREPDTINGYPYFLNNDLATIAVNAKTVLFGQLNKYVIRQVRELSVLRLVERYADYGQVAFVGFARADGNLLDAGTHPVKYLQQAAS